MNGTGARMLARVRVNDKGSLIYRCVIQLVG